MSGFLESVGRFESCYYVADSERVPGALALK